MKLAQSSVAEYPKLIKFLQDLLMQRRVKLIKADPLNCLIKTLLKNPSLSTFNSEVDYTFPFSSWASATRSLAPDCHCGISPLSLLSVKDESVKTAISL